MDLETEKTLTPVRGVVAAVVLLLCVTTTVPVTAMGFGHGESFSPFLTVLDWLGLTGVVEVVVGELPGERPILEKEGGMMDPNGVSGSDDGSAAPDWPAAVSGSDGG